MQKSGKSVQSAHRKVKSSCAKNRKSIQRPSANTNMARKPSSPKMQSAKVSKAVKSSPSEEEPKARIILAEDREMIDRPRMKKRTLSIIEHESEPEIIATNPKTDDDVPEDVELLSLSDSEYDLVPTSVSKISAKEIKERAIAKALSEAARPQEKKVIERPMRTHFSWGRIALAFMCAATAAFAITYFVNLNSPDISFKVAAMQTGIEASYPSYVPRDYSLSDITSENGKITLNFKNSVSDGAFTIVEEKSSWDSNTLMANYVQVEYDNDYTMIREQGLTLFISGSDAAWVNGGVIYKLKTTSGSLTKKQIKAIAVSL